MIGTGACGNYSTCNALELMTKDLASVFTALFTCIGERAVAIMFVKLVVPTSRRAVCSLSNFVSNPAFAIVSPTLAVQRIVLCL